MKNMEDEIIDILRNLKEHIIYDKNIRQICYSARFIKAKNEIIKILENNKLTRTQNDYL